MGLLEQRERIYQDGLGKVATNTKQQNARYTPEMMRNAKIDSNQYERYKEVLKEDAGSLADFRQMKYNDPENGSSSKWIIKDKRSFWNIQSLNYRMQKRLFYQSLSLRNIFLMKTVKKGIQREEPLQIAWAMKWEIGRNFKKR